MKDLRVVFMGTPEFAIPVLNKLIELTNVVLVVTRADAYVGRKKILTPSPIKEVAINNNIPVITPNKLKEEYQNILDYKPDLIVTCAYGKILNKEILDYPKYGCLNIHASLLPKYRGSSPMQYAIMNGDKKTGVTLMYMDEGMDTGDIIDTLECNINETDTLEDIHNTLMVLGANIIAKNLENIINNNITRIKQDNNLATYAPKIEREDEELDFNNDVIKIYNKIRAFSPYPLTRTIILDEEVKIVKAHYELTKCDIGKIYQNKDNLGIGCLNGIIYFDIIKPVGKNMMDIKSYLNGKKSK